MKLYCTILFITILTTVNANANQHDSLVNRIFNLAYNQEYILADSILQSSKNKIDELYFTVLEIDMSYWKNVTGTNNPDYNAFEATQKKYKPTNAKTFNQKVIQLITLSYQLRYELKRYHFFSAVTTHKKTRHIYDELITNAKATEFNHQELLELYRSMFSYFDNYLHVFGGKKKKTISQQALANMEILANSEKEIVKTLASYYVAKIYLKYEKVPEKGMPYFQYLCEKYPDNIKFPEFLSDCETKLAK